MSCFDCIHSQPTGCSLNRPEFEKYVNCAAFELGQRDGRLLTGTGEKSPKGILTFNVDISGPASSINVQKGDGE